MAGRLGGVREFQRNELHDCGDLRDGVARVNVDVRGIRVKYTPSPSGTVASAPATRTVFPLQNWTTDGRRHAAKCDGTRPALR